jgi:hypothetical protein
VQGYKNRSVFSKIVKNRWNRTGLNLKTVEILFTVSKFQKKIKISKIYVVHCFKISEKIKISKIYVKN